MADYNRFERSLARLLSSFPQVKYFIKRIYAWFNYCLYRKPYKSEYRGVLTCYGENGTDTFWGYYDKCPENESRSHVVYHQVAEANLPVFNRANIVIENFQSGEKKILETRAVNYQQGARTQWLNNDNIIFNDYDSAHDRYIAKNYNVMEQTVTKTFSMPVYDCFKNEFALTLNFARLACFAKDYGYLSHNRAGDPSCLADDSNDGIWRINLETGKYELIVTFDQLMSPKTSNQIEQTVNHIMLSPAGERFIFIYRCYVNGVRNDTLYMCSSDGENLDCIVDSGMVSHCSWVSEGVIIGFFKNNDGQYGYWLYSLNDNSVSPLSIKGMQMHGDGHPSVYGENLITDTYPNRSALQKLLLVNLESGRCIKLGEFFHSLNFHGENRCDLHPRFSRDGKSVYFDSIFTGQRKLYKLTF